MTQPNPTQSRTAIVMGGLVALALIGCVTLLIALGKSTGDLIALVGTGIMPILGVALYGQLSGIRQNTNGTTGELVAMVKSLQATVKELGTELARRPHPATNSGPEPSSESSSGIWPSFPG